MNIEHSAIIPQIVVIAVILGIGFTSGYVIRALISRARRHQQRRS
jgi:hypothetical protein